MKLNSPESQPEKDFSKDKTGEKPNNDPFSKVDDTPKKNKTDYKDKKIEGSSQKPKGKPKNKIGPRKIDIQKEPRHKIQHQKHDPKTPPRNRNKPPTDRYTERAKT